MIEFSDPDGYVHSLDTAVVGEREMNRLFFVLWLYLTGQMDDGKKREWSKDRDYQRELSDYVVEIRSKVAEGVIG
jgi:hypothetical protein